LLLLAMLSVANGVASPLIVAYPLLVVGSGLWFRVRFVWFMTLLSLLSYGILVMDFYWWHPELQSQFDARYHRHVIFAVTLILLGAVTAYLVHRVRVLSSFYGRQVP
jgi:eukaryotic-like serine/threonine-protein kinase